MNADSSYLKAVIFDLDGTLINSAPDVRLALNHTLAIYGQSGIGQDEIYTLIGSGIKSLMTKAFKKKKITLTNEEIDNAILHYLNYYQAHPVVETKLYPDVITILQQLKQDGFQLGLCTNKPAIMTKIVLQQLNLDYFFRVVISGDEVVYPKPHPDHLHEVLRKMNIFNLSAVMVGDSVLDKVIAKKAGIPFIGVRYGYEHDRLDADIMINHFCELPMALNSLLLSK